METAKQVKKKEYNENYKRKILMDIENLSKKSNEKVEKVEKVKEVEPETDIQKLIDQRLSFIKLQSFMIYAKLNASCVLVLDKVNQN